MKKVINLTEHDLHNIISESIQRVLNETDIYSVNGDDNIQSENGLEFMTLNKLQNMDPQEAMATAQEMIAKFENIRFGKILIRPIIDACRRFLNQNNNN